MTAYFCFYTNNILSNYFDSFIVTFGGGWDGAEARPQNQVKLGENKVRFLEANKNERLML